MTDEAFNLFNSRFMIWELVISALVPLTIVFFGIYVDRRLKKLEADLKQNNSLIEKRMDIYDHMRVHLNIIYCACAKVGNWRNQTPPDVLAAKRECDAIFFTHLAFWNADVTSQYKAFTDACFATYRGEGFHAALLANPEDYKTGFKEAWNDSWQDYFLEATERADWISKNLLYNQLFSNYTYTKDIVIPRYAELISAFSENFGTETSHATITRVLSPKNRVD